MYQIKSDQDFYLKLLNTLPASIHVLEINNQLDASVIWANKNYEETTGITLSEREKIGFLDQSNVFNKDDSKEIKAAFRRFINNEHKKESIIARFKVSFTDEKWCYIRSQKIDLIPGKTHIISILFTLEDGLVVNPNKLDYYINENKRLRNQLKLSSLTKAEKNVLHLLGKGLSTKETANYLCRSFNTINNHRRSIFVKLNFHKISELVAFTKDVGLV